MQVVSSTGSTTLSAAITTTGQTAISVANSQNMAAGVVIQVQTELMQITAIAGLNLTVTRGFNGTAAATHTSGTTVTMMAAIAMGTLLNSTTAAPATSLAITGAQIRIDGTVYGSSSTVATTDAWGLAWLYTSLSAGPHRIEVQTSTTLPWTEPCFYVGPVGSIALQNAGLALQLYGNVVSGISGTQFTCNLPYPATSLTNLQGQILTFTSGVLAGQGFVLAGAGHSGSNVTLNVLYGWGTNPSAGDAFTLSNVATANSMTEGLDAIPGEVQALVIDLTGENGGDGSAITTLAGVVKQPSPTSPTISPEGFTTLWALSPGAVGVPLNCIGTINGAGNYTNDANTLPLAWNEGGNGRWGIAVGYTNTWLGPTTQNSPLGVYTCADHPSYTVVASAPTDATIQADLQADLIPALLAAGLLEYVSGTSGPIRLTAAALAHIPPATVVNIETDTTIDNDNGHHHHHGDS